MARNALDSITRSADVQASGSLSRTLEIWAAARDKCAAVFAPGAPSVDSSVSDWDCVAVSGGSGTWRRARDDGDSC